MAKSKYEYVKSFEKVDTCLLGAWIVCRIDGKNFHTFSSKHGFKKPNDKDALNLMNAAAVSVISDNSDIFMAYGQSDEYSFILRSSTTIFDRRESKLLSTIVSKFSSSYTFYWNRYFPDKQLLYPPSFDGRIILYPGVNFIRDYLSWRQTDCHINNLYNTCYWKIVLEEKKDGKEAENELKDTNSAIKNEILFSRFNTNYNNEPEIFRKGSVLIRKDYLSSEQLDKMVKSNHKNILLFHGDIIGNGFWTMNPKLLSD